MFISKVLAGDMHFLSTTQTYAFYMFEYVYFKFSKFFCSIVSTVSGGSSVKRVVASLSDLGLGRLEQ